MESVDKLREYADSFVCWDLVPVARERLDAMLDEIEEEFALYSLRSYPKPFGSHEAMHMVLGTAADNFDTPEEAVDYMSGETSMPLPADKDGVPIRVGDILERVDGWPSQQACCIGPYGFNDAPIWCARDFRHVKPRTLEDVLAEFGRESVGASMQQTNALLAKYADEIRELLEVGE